MTIKTTGVSVGPAPTAEQIRQAHTEKLDATARYRRVTNYLAAAQIYLKDNVLLEGPLKPEQIKDRLLGHWGTSPGINLIYAHLNALIMRHDIDMFLSQARDMERRRTWQTCISRARCKNITPN